jgi:hypothetical protein
MNTADHIKSILTEQVSCYRTLLKILRRKRESPFHFNAPEVEALSKEKKHRRPQVEAPRRRTNPARQVLHFRAHD